MSETALRVLVTGATGFVGRHVVRALLERTTHRLVCLARNARELESLKATNPSRIEILAKPVEELGDGLSGSINTVIHLAALIDSNDARQMERVNVAGTQAALSLAQAQGAQFIFLSSCYAGIEDEENFYGSTKRRAERIVQESGLTFTILRASLIYGPGDFRNFGKIAAMASRLPVVPVFGRECRLQPLHIKDLVFAIFKCIDNPVVAGKIYGIGGAEVVSLPELVKRYLQVRATPKPVVVLPPLLVSCAAFLAQRLIPGSPLTTAKLKRLSRMPAVDPKPILNDLGFQLTPLKEGLRLI